MQCSPWHATCSCSVPKAEVFVNLVTLNLALSVTIIPIDLQIYMHITISAPDWNGKKGAMLVQYWVLLGIPLGAPVLPKLWEDLLTLTVTLTLTQIQIDLRLYVHIAMSRPDGKCVKRAVLVLCCPLNSLFSPCAPGVQGSLNPNPNPNSNPNVPVDFHGHCH